MPYSSGTYTPAIDFVTESASPPIEISKLDQQMDDLATALSTCILRDGTGLPTASIDWNGQAITNGGAFTATRLIVTGSTVPANGVYLSAANTVAIASNTTLRLSVNSTGNWVMAAPSSGTSVTAALASDGASALTLTQSTFDGRFLGGTTAGLQVGTISAHGLVLYTNSGNRLTISSAGVVVINPPSSGTALTVTGQTDGVPLYVNSVSFESMRINSNQTGPYLSMYRSAARKAYIQWDATSGLLVVQEENLPLILYTNSIQRMNIAAAGNVTINAPSSGVCLSVSDGSLGVPAIGFSSDTDTGLYRSAANTMILMAGGVRCIQASGTAGDATIGNSSSSTVSINALGQTSAVAGAADALPAAPVGYLNITVNGFARVIPYYDPS